MPATKTALEANPKLRDDLINCFDDHIGRQIALDIRQDGLNAKCEQEYNRILRELRGQ